MGIGSAVNIFGWTAPNIVGKALAYTVVLAPLLSVYFSVQKSPYLKMYGIFLWILFLFILYIYVSHFN